MQKTVRNTILALSTALGLGACATPPGGAVYRGRSVEGGGSYGGASGAPAGEYTGQDNRREPMTRNQMIARRTTSLPREIKEAERSGDYRTAERLRTESLDLKDAIAASPKPRGYASGHGGYGSIPFLPGGNSYSGNSGASAGPLEFIAPFAGPIIAPFATGVGSGYRRGSRSIGREVGRELSDAIWGGFSKKKHH